MASIKQSRFALLKVEDDDDDVQQQKKQANKESNQTKNSQKKSKKKKKNQQEDLQLKHMAFGKATRHRVQSGGSDHSGHQISNGKGQQWDEWQKLDVEYAKDTFEKDLQQALLLSKLELEEDKQKKKSQPSNNNTAPSSATMGAGDSKDSKKKKKKEKTNKPNTMSLEEFNQKLEEKKTFADELETVPSPTQSQAKLPAEVDQKFFQTVDNDVNRILRQEKMQEEYKKQYAAESVITAKYTEEAKKKDKEIEFLRATLKKQEEELKQVKKRNKQLCVILAQGEMKDKAEVLMQVEELSAVRDELTEQVSDLTADLEKERSKVHALRSELDKYNSKQSGKHK